MDLTSRPLEEFIGERDLTDWKSPAGRLLAALIERVAKFTTWRWLMLLMVTVAAAVTYGGTVLVGEVLESIHEEGWAARIDVPLMEFAVRHRPAWAGEAVTWFTHLGGSIVTPVVAVVALAYLTWRFKTRTPIVVGLIAGAGSLAMTIAGKLAVGRPRPPTSMAVPPFEHSWSFPSGHAMNAVVIAGVIAYLILTRVSKRSTMVLVSSLAALYALLMGMSRVYLGHHWFTDVVAGWIVGGAWLAIVITAHRLHLTHFRYHEQVAEAERAQLANDQNESGKALSDKDESAPAHHHAVDAPETEPDR